MISAEDYRWDETQETHYDKPDLIDLIIEQMDDSEKLD
jgi:hypothetical protein